jgi:hypothetical protein
MKKEFINDIEIRLRARVPEMVTFGVFNNQFENEPNEIPFRYPAIFIEFQELTYRSETFGSQKIDLEFILHVGFTQLRENLSYFDTIQNVGVALHGFAGSYFSEITRLRAIPDNNHGNVIVWQITFRTTLTDETTFVPNQLIEINTPRTVGVSKGLDIDNPIVRSGNGI